MLKVEYVRTLDDYVDYVLHLSRGLPSYRKLILHQRCLVLFIFLGMAIATWFLCDSPPMIIVVCVVVTAIAAVSWVRIPKDIWRKVKAGTLANVIDLGIETATVELILTEESLLMVTDEMRMEVRWNRIRGVEVVGDCTYIKMLGGMAAVVVREGFERDRDYFAVREFALRKLEDEADLASDE